jgi:hypothetical protein
LTWQLFHTKAHAEKQLLGSGAAHDLRWVMLVYTALLVGRLHHQQQGLTAVQLHVAQPASTDHSSSSTQAPQNRGSAGSSSASSSNKSTRKKASKTASRAQQASSSSAAASKTAPQQQVSVVPPYHSEVLRLAGLPSTQLADSDQLTATPDRLVGDILVPITVLVLSNLLHELQKHLKLQHHNAAAATGAATSSNSTSSHTSATACSSSLAGGPAAQQAVLALLAPCSLMWGEALALFAGAGLDSESLTHMSMVLEQVWYSGCEIIYQQAIAVQAGQLADPLQAVNSAGEPQEQLSQELRHLHWVAQQDSWYRSCVELIVPSLLHMKATGGMDSAAYAASARVWFRRLEVMLQARTCAAAYGKLEAKLSIAIWVLP